MAKPTSSFWDHPIAHIEEALHLRKQIESLQAKLGRLVGGKTEATPKRVIKRRGRKGKPQISTKAPTQSAAAKPKTKKKGGLTPEGRARLAASMKARWAARRKAAGQ